MNKTLDDAEKQIAWLKSQIHSEREEHEREVAKLKDERDMLRYCVKSICNERLSLRVHVSEQMLASQSTIDLVQTLVAHHARASAVQVEKALGERYELLKAYDDAKRYIMYLQNHAGGRGVQFTPFEERTFR